MPTDETQLIRRAQGGDRDAFAQLLARFEKPVYHQALRMVGHAEDAADLTQEVFLKVWQGLPSFQGDSSFSTWLYRLTSNACIDFLRREKRRRGTLSLDDEERELVASCRPRTHPPAGPGAAGAPPGPDRRAGTAVRRAPAGAHPPGAQRPVLRRDRPGAVPVPRDGEVPHRPGPLVPCKIFAKKRELFRSPFVYGDKEMNLALSRPDLTCEGVTCHEL